MCFEDRAMEIAGREKEIKYVLANCAGVDVRVTYPTGQVENYTDLAQRGGIYVYTPPGSMQ